MLDLISVHGHVGPINHDGMARVCATQVCAWIVSMCAHGSDHTAQPKCDSAHWGCDCDCLTIVKVSVAKVDSTCSILDKGVPFVPVAMQHGATEDVLLWQKCALCANITFVFTTDR